METTTVRVDIQKLQLLNERICQTIDALNQLRFSAHSLAAVNPYQTQAYAGGIGYGVSPFLSPVHSGFVMPQAPITGPVGTLGQPRPYANGSYPSQDLDRVRHSAYATAPVSW